MNPVRLIHYYLRGHSEVKYLLNDILKAGGSIVVPNIEFLRQSYTEKLQRGEDYSTEFK